MADQTFGFMDGSQYNINGQQITPPTAPTSAVTPVTVNPSTQVNSNQLSSPKTNLDIQSILQDNLNKQDGLFSQIQGFFTPTQQELDYQKQYTDYQTKLNDLALKQDQLALDTNAKNFEYGHNGGLTSIANSQISENNLRAGFAQSNLAIQQGALSRQQQVALQTLQNAQANRTQKLEAAKYLYDATRNKLSDTITLMKATAPENIGNVVDPQTGEMTVIMKNPITGEVTRNNLGVVQTPQRALDNVKMAQDAGVTQPFYSRDGKTVINTQNGREYSSIEQAAADGVDTKGWSNVQWGVKSLGQQQLDIQKSQLDQGKYQAIDIGTDQFGNPIKGVLNTKTGKTSPLGTAPDGSSDYTQAVNDMYADGNVGPGKGSLKGQCAVFAEAICDFGTPGNLLGMNLKDKQKTVNAYGLKADDWRNEGAQVGDGLIFNYGSNGHVAVITAVNGDGTAVVKQSNKNGDGKITTETINLNNKSIYGAIRGTLKNIQTGQGNGAQSANTSDYVNAFRNAAIGLPVNAQQAYSRQLQSLISSGNIDGAKELITRVATSTAPVEQQNQAQGRSEALGSLNAISSALQKYQQAGGDTNIFTGTEEQIANKVGATKDPKLAYLANQINQAFINYRRSMTGVAFSPQESAQYEKLFPSIGKVSNFNTSVIQSLQDTMNRNQELFLKNRIGKTSYENIFGSTQSSNQSQQTPEDAYIQSILSGTSSNNTTKSAPSTQSKIVNGLLYANPLTYPVVSTINYIKSLFK